VDDHGPLEARHLCLDQHGLGWLEPHYPLFLPLLEHVAPRWSEADSLVKWVKGHLDDPKDRAEVEDEIAATAIGWRLWSEERDRLALWAGKGKEGPLSAEDNEDWWLNGDRRLTVDEQARLGDR